MAEFGKRNAPGAPSARTATKSAAYSAPRADLDEAERAVQQGKLPPWTKIGPIRLGLGVVFFAAIIVFLVPVYGGELVRDLRLAGTWQPAFELRARDGRCTVHNFVVTTCSATVYSVAEPNAQPRNVQFVMLLTSGGGEQLTPVRSTADPGAVSIGYAAETELWNRAITFAILIVSLSLMDYALAMMLVRGRYQGGARHRALLAGLQALQTREEPSRMAA